MTRRDTLTPEQRWESYRQRYTIADPLLANYLIIFWEQRSHTARANYFRKVLDRKLAEFSSIKPPKTRQSEPELHGRQLWIGDWLFFNLSP